MKKNNKGFTLIELLAVVVILLAISVIAISSISAAMERNKAKQDDAKKQVIVSYAELYYQEHRNEIAQAGKLNEGCISLSVLGLSESEATDANDNIFTGGVRYSSNGTVFEYDENCG